MKVIVFIKKITLKTKALHFDTNTAQTKVKLLYLDTP